jgi:hypothetical protein
VVAEINPVAGTVELPADYANETPVTAVGAAIAGRFTPVFGATGEL